MGFEHTKGRRVPPKNLHLLPKRRSCHDCGLLDELFIRIKNDVGKGTVWDCRRPDGPRYESKRHAERYVCSGYETALHWKTR